jgi:hypothetical protein
MGRVTSLFEKIGLVYRSEPPTVASEGSAPPPASGQSTKPVGDISPGPTPLRIDVPEVHLDTSALQQPAGDEYPLSQIYASASIKEPANGFTVYRLMEMLDAEELRGLEPETRAKVITGMLRRLPSGAVEVDDIVREAVLRDRALDAFDKFLADRLARQEKDIEEKNRALQQEIDELTIKNTELMDANRAGIDKERGRIERWRLSKRSEEDRLYAAVAPFVKDNPVTRDDPKAVAAPPTPEPDKK